VKAFCAIGRFEQQLSLHAQGIRAIDKRQRSDRLVGLVLPEQRDLRAIFQDASGKGTGHDHVAAEVDIA